MYYLNGIKCPREIPGGGWRFPIDEKEHIHPPPCPLEHSGMHYSNTIPKPRTGYKKPNGQAKDLEYPHVIPPRTLSHFIGRYIPMGKNTIGWMAYDTPLNSIGRLPNNVRMHEDHWCGRMLPPDGWIDEQGFVWPYDTRTNQGTLEKKDWKWAYGDLPAQDQAPAYAMGSHDQYQGNHPTSEGGYYQPHPGDPTATTSEHGGVHFSHVPPGGSDGSRGQGNYSGSFWTSHDFTPPQTVKQKRTWNLGGLSSGVNGVASPMTKTKGSFGSSISGMSQQPSPVAHGYQIPSPSGGQAPSPAQ